MKLKTQLALALLAVATGCASNHEKIVFSDEAEIRAQTTTPTSSAPAKQFDSADDAQIEELAFGYLLENHLWSLADCAAIFIQADDQEVAAVAAKFPNHVPVIKPASQAVLKSHRPPRDKGSKQPAILLTVEISEPSVDGSVDVTARWYAGEPVTGSRSLHLTKANGAWQIMENK
jgi:hypothetical protein